MPAGPPTNRGVRTRRARFADDWLCLSAYAALTMIATWPLVLHPRSAIPGSGDAYQFYWNLWWVKRALIDLHANPYVTADLFAPYGASLYFHTLNLLQGILVLPIILSFGLGAAYNATVFMSFVLTGYGGYRLALYALEHEIDPGGAASHRRAAQLAAFVAGASLAFSSYRFVHLLGHLDLLSTQWLPFFVLFLLKTRREAGWRNPIWCGACLAFATLTSSYYGAFLFVFLALFAAFVLAQREPGWRSQIARLVVAVAVFVIVVSPLLGPMLLRGRLEGRAPNPAYDLVRFSGDLLAYVVPSPLHPLLGRWSEPAYRVMDRAGSGLESVMFLGYVPLALTLVALGTRTRRLAFWLAASAAFALLALGPELHVAGHAVPQLFSLLMPYRWLAKLPYGDIPRVPSRLVVMTILCLSVMTAAGAMTVLRRSSMTGAIGLAAALVAAIVFENAVWPTPLGDLRVTPVFDRLAREPRAAVLEVPIPDDPARFPRRMLWQTVHHQPVFGGYLSRSRPPLAFEAVPGFAQFKRLTLSIDDVVAYDQHQLPALSRAVLGVYGAGHVVVEQELMTPADGGKARTIAEALLGADSLHDADDSIFDYTVPRVHEAIVPGLWLDTGWSYLERLAEHDASGRARRWRWMSDVARLGLVTSEPARVSVKLTLQSFDRSRRLRLAIDGAEIATMVIATDRVAYESPSFSLPAGASFIQLTSLDGAESPGGDLRRLSVAIFDAAVVVGINADAAAPRR